MLPARLEDGAGIVLPLLKRTGGGEIIPVIWGRRTNQSWRLLKRQIIRESQKIGRVPSRRRRNLPGPREPDSSGASGGGAVRFACRRVATQTRFNRLISPRFFFSFPSRDSRRPTTTPPPRPTTPCWCSTTRAAAPRPAPSAPSTPPAAGATRTTTTSTTGARASGNWRTCTAEVTTRGAALRSREKITRKGRRDVEEKKERGKKRKQKGKVSRWWTRTASDIPPPSDGTVAEKIQKTQINKHWFRIFF